MLCDSVCKIHGVTVCNYKYVELISVFGKGKNSHSWSLCVNGLVIARLTFCIYNFTDFAVS